MIFFKKKRQDSNWCCFHLWNIGVRYNCTEKMDVGIYFFGFYFFLTHCLIAEAALTRVSVPPNCWQHEMLVDLRFLSFIHKLIPFPKLLQYHVPPSFHLPYVSFYITLDNSLKL